MKKKFRVKFYRLFKAPMYVICTRSLRSTRRFARKKLFHKGIIYYTIKKHNTK